MPLNALFSRAKAAKSRTELAGISDACCIADAAQRAVRGAIRSGMNELELYDRVSAALNKAAKGVALPLSEIQVGARTVLGMGSPTQEQVGPNDLVICDIAPRHPNGFWADSCSTLVCGEPSANQLTTWRRLSDGLQAGQEALRSGVTASEVYAAVARYAGGQPGHVGHGIGWDHFEEPLIAEGNREPLAEGCVIALEPGYYGKDWGMRIEHAFRVGADGGVPLMTFSLELSG
jgi:Xaa-Pro aminopeptidase